MIKLIELSFIDYSHTILEIVLLIIGLYLAFFKSYFQEKGKNLATQQDIGEITKTVESIKTDLAFSGQLKFSIKSEKRNAVLDCYSKYHLWLSFLMNFSVSSDFTESNEDISKNSDALNQIYFDFTITEAKVDLYMPDQPGLMIVLNELKIKTNAIYHLTEIFVINMTTLSKKYEIKEKADLSFEEMQVALEDFGKSQIDTIRAYINKRLELYNDVIKTSNVFKSKCYELIISLNH